MRQNATWFILILIGGAFASFFLATALPGGWAGAGLAQVGVSVGVLPNPYNSLNAQLSQKEAYLNEQQAYLNQQEAALTSSTQQSSAFGVGMSAVLWYLVIVVTLLAIFLALNFYLDWRRERKERAKIVG